MHITPPRAALALFPLLAATGAAFLIGDATHAAAPQEVVELEVLGVVPLESEAASILVLRQKGAQVVLPIHVGREEGAIIDLRLRRAPSSRSHAIDLLAGAIVALGGKVTRVEIQSVHAALFRARVLLQQGDRRLELEGRPSDSVALALAEHAPIFAARKVMAEVGLGPSDLDRMREPPPQAEEQRLGPVESF
jgi:hypothetical protein